MEIDVPARKLATYSTVLDVQGREHVLLVIKAAFGFPETATAPCLPLDEIDPPVFDDEFSGEPGLSATVRESELSAFKPQCDVVLNASAHAPGGRPTQSVTVGARVGNWSKSFDVLGNRRWVETVAIVNPSEPEHFTTQPISYDVAFGGVDNLDRDEELPAAYLDNPVGVGWHRRSNLGRIHNKPVPNTQKRGESVSVPWGSYTPMSFGHIGRGWPQRLPFAGTYDQNWLDNVFPFLPKDFDPRYFQSAPADQWIPYPRGGEPVQLYNLTPEGQMQFQLPQLDLPVTFGIRRHDDVQRNAVVDTLFIEPDRRRFHVVWRATLPLQRDIFEVNEAIIGRKPKGFWRARRLGKTYHPGLGNLVRSGAATDEDAS